MFVTLAGDIVAVYTFDGELTLTRFTYTYEEVNSHQPAHALWSDLTGEITTPRTRYTRPSQRDAGIYGIRTMVHNLTEARAPFADLSGTNITFRLYMGDGASLTGEQRFDDIRLYAIDDTSPPETVVIVR